MENEELLKFKITKKSSLTFLISAFSVNLLLALMFGYFAFFQKEEFNIGTILVQIVLISNPINYYLNFNKTKLALAKPQIDSIRFSNNIITFFIYENGKLTPQKFDFKQIESIELSLSHLQLKAKDSEESIYDASIFNFKDRSKLKDWINKISTIKSIA